MRSCGSNEFDVKRLADLTFILQYFFCNTLHGREWIRVQICMSVYGLTVVNALAFFMIVIIFRYHHLATP